MAYLLLISMQVLINWPNMPGWGPYLHVAFVPVGINF